MKTKQEYLLSIPFEYLLHFIGHSYLVRPKNDYFTKKDFVRRIIRTLSASDCEWLHSMYLRKVPSRKVAELFLIKYPTANIIREAFVDQLVKNDCDEIGELSYEFPIPKTRIDIARIQGDSFAYEIKSIRDSSRRIEHQINTIKRIFEKNYLVLPKDKNLLSSLTIDRKVGVYYYSTEDQNILFKRNRKARKMTSFDSLKQLQLFWEKELTGYYCEIFNEIPEKTGRTVMEQLLVNRLSSKEINTKFKDVLRIRFQ